MIAALIGIAGIFLLGALSPGPNFVIITRQAVRSRRLAVWTATGVSTGSLIWASLTLGGLGLVLARLAWFYEILRWGGAAYLVYIGCRMLLASLRGGDLERSEDSAPSSVRSAFRLGLTTSLTNPKSAAYWSSVFVVALPPVRPLWFDAAVLVLIASMAMGWYVLLAMLFGAEPVRRTYRRIARWIDGLTGAVLIGLGLRLIAGKSAFPAG